MACLSIASVGIVSSTSLSRPHRLKVNWFYYYYFLSSCVCRLKEDEFGCPFFNVVGWLEIVITAFARVNTDHFRQVPGRKKSLYTRNGGGGGGGAKIKKNFKKICLFSRVRQRERGREDLERWLQSFFGWPWCGTMKRGNLILENLFTYNEGLLSQSFQVRGRARKEKKKREALGQKKK